MLKNDDDGNGANLVGESFLTVPGPRSEAINGCVADAAARKVSRRKVDAEKLARDTEFTKTLNADEDILATSLGEIYHAVIHARFAMNEPTETAAHLAKALVATERGLETIVKRMKYRPSPYAFLNTAIIGVGAVSIAAWSLLGMYSGKPKPKSDAPKT
jgi:hypothetical protein